MILAFAIMVGEEILPDTVYDHEALSKAHYLAFVTGDYDDSDFHMTPNRLDQDAEFRKYPEASVVRVEIKAHKMEPNSND